ncbi:MAG: ycjS 2 [Pedosphaera sp.]|nr:ycjS 2 [Pedosphaera sp.]
MSRRKSILIVGVGSIGERHLRCFQGTGRADVSLCELNPLLRKTVADRYQIVKAFDDLTRALDDKPDMVVICTPAHLHISMALAAAQRGIHLLIEKPLGTSLEGINALRKEVISRKIVAGVAYVYRAHPALASMREAIHSGRFGEPVQIVSTSGQHFPFYRPVYRETYYKNRATGGGAVQDALTHVVNAGEWLVGAVTSLTADAAHQVLEGVEVEDTVHLLTRHDNVLGSFSLNQHQAPNESSITVICKKGTLRFEMHNSRWRWQIEPGDTWHDEAAAKLERDTLFTRQADSFLDAIEGINPPLCNLEEGIQTLQVNLASLRSIEDRRWQALSVSQ